MRGRTLSNAHVIIDEAQNTTPVQMKMVLTGLAKLHMVITVISVRLICLMDSHLVLQRLRILHNIYGG